MRCIASVIPLLLKYQGTGKIHAVVREDGLQVQHLDMEGYMGLVEFGAWRQRSMQAELTNLDHGGGLVIQASKNEFYLVGTNYRLKLRAKPTFDKMQPTLLFTHHRKPEFLNICSAWMKVILIKTINSCLIGGVMVMR